MNNNPFNFFAEWVAIYLAATIWGCVLYSYNTINQIKIIKIPHIVVKKYKISNPSAGVWV